MGHSNYYSFAIMIATSFLESLMETRYSIHIAVASLVWLILPLTDNASQLLQSQLVHYTCRRVSETALVRALGGGHYSTKSPSDKCIPILPTALSLSPLF